MLILISVLYLKQPSLQSNQLTRLSTYGLRKHELYHGSVQYVYKPDWPDSFQYMSAMCICFILRVFVVPYLYLLYYVCIAVLTFRCRTAG